MDKLDRGAIVRQWALYKAEEFDVGISPIAAAGERSRYRKCYKIGADMLLNKRRQGGDNGRALVMRVWL